MLMPDMDGLDLAARIHALRPGLPIVLASSVNQHEVVADPRWTAAGIDAVVTKPIKASPLHGALATVLGGSDDGDEHGRSRGVRRRPSPSDHPLRILLAEDNVVNQKLAIRLLEKLGYRANIAGNGVEALEALERQPYDLLLSDVQMPEMDGLEATRRIMERWPEGERPWIVAMTAEAMSGDRERCLEAGMNDYLTKPIRVEELVAAIKRAPRRADQVPDPDGDGPIDRDALARLADERGGDADVRRGTDRRVLDRCAGADRRGPCRGWTRATTRRCAVPRTPSSRTRRRSARRRCPIGAVRSRKPRNRGSCRTPPR